MTNEETTNDQGRIASANIVFVCAQSGTGKTFTGDYLSVAHGFNHVDGDGPFRNMHIKKNQDVVMKLIELDQDNPESEYYNTDGPNEMWQPYMQLLVDQTLAAAKESKKVVLTYMVNRQTHRDFIMTKLEEGGANNVSMLFLTIDEDVKLNGLYSRSKGQAEAAGMTLGDWWRAMVGWEGEGDLSFEEFKEFVLRPGQQGSMIFHDPPLYAKVVDVSARDVTAIDGVDKALKLVRTGEAGTYEEIVQKCLDIDHKRDVEQPYMNSEPRDGDAKEAEVEDSDEIKRRRSSLISIDRTLREFSATSLSDTDGISGADKAKKGKARRESLIMTGKIE